MQFDKDFLKNEEYKNSSNYENRISLLNYAKPTFNLWEWTANQYDFKSSPSILEVGCGNGTFWHFAASKLSKQHHVTITDFSDGMLETTRKNLQTIKFSCPIEFKIADVENLSFSDQSFDTVLAHLMLYHAESQEQALAEIKRVLKPNGWAGFSTVALDSLLEIYILAHQVDSRVPRHPIASEPFSGEKAENLLTAVFSSIKKQSYSANIFLSHPEPVLQSMRSGFVAQKLKLTDDFFKEFERVIADEIKQKGILTTKFNFDLYICS